MRFDVSCTWLRLSEYLLLSPNFFRLNSWKCRRFFVILHKISINTQMSREQSDDYYYRESKRLRAEVLQLADTLKGQPIRIVVENGITMEVEITKSDLRTLVGKSTRSNKFNAIKNALARDIISYLNKAEYLGWRTVIEGKHPEAAYFAYYSRELGARTILCMRRMADGGMYKPYAIISQQMFDAEVKNLKKGTPF